MPEFSDNTPVRSLLDPDLPLVVPDDERKTLTPDTLNVMPSVQSVLQKLTLVFEERDWKLKRVDKLYDEELKDLQLKWVDKLLGEESGNMEELCVRLNKLRNEKMKRVEKLLNDEELEDVEKKHKCDEETKLFLGELKDLQETMERARERATERRNTIYETVGKTQQHIIKEMGINPYEREFRLASAVLKIGSVQHIALVEQCTYGGHVCKVTWVWARLSF